MKKIFSVLSFIFILGNLAACGGGTSVSPGPPGAKAAPVSLTLRDAPPTGVTVLSFELTVVDAVLQPGNVSLLTDPIKVEVEHLQVDSLLLNTKEAAPGNYTSIDVMVSNPELTIKNDTGASLGPNCATGAICELSLPLSPAKVTISFSPSLTLTTGMPIGLELDLDLANSIPSNLANITPTFKVSQIAAVQGTGELEELDDVVGMVTAIDTTNKTFTLQPSEGGNSLTIGVDANTRFKDFDEVGCMTADFSCVMMGQMLEVSAKLMDGGMLVATKVSIENEDHNPEELRGILVALSGMNQFQLVVLDEQPNIQNLSVGMPITVNVLPNAQFSVQQGDSDQLSISGLSFSSFADLVVGQFIQIKPRSTAMGTPPAVDTDSIRLKQGSVTGTVKATPSTARFTINNPPKLFADAGITEIDVDGTAAELEGVNAITSLSAGDMVSVRGLLFHQAMGNPVIVAQKIRKR
jgi:hypothetical protein